jgi:hypothetical protein
VRAVLVCDDGQLVGVVTRKTLVQRIVATGRDPRATSLGDIAEPPLFTIDASIDLDEAFPLLEDRTSSASRSSRTAGSSGSSRAPCCSAGSPRTSPPALSSRCRRRAAPRLLPLPAARPPRARAVEDVALADLELVDAEERQRFARDHRAATITGARSGSSGACVRARDGTRKPLELLASAAR